MKIVLKSVKLNTKSKNVFKSNFEYFKSENHS